MAYEVVDRDIPRCTGRRSHAGRHGGCREVRAAPRSGNACVRPRQAVLTALALRGPSARACCPPEAKESGDCSAPSEVVFCRIRRSAGCSGSLTCRDAPDRACAGSDRQHRTVAEGLVNMRARPAGKPGGLDGGALRGARGVSARRRRDPADLATCLAGGRWPAAGLLFRSPRVHLTDAAQTSATRRVPA